MKGILMPNLHEYVGLYYFLGIAFDVKIRQGQLIASQLDEYIELQQVMMPAAQFQVESVGQDVKLSITSLPPAVSQMLSAQYQDLLSQD
jgi:hypothetical protein